MDRCLLARVFRAFEKPDVGTMSKLIEKILNCFTWKFPSSFIFSSSKPLQIRVVSESSSVMGVIFKVRDCANYGFEIRLRRVVGSAQEMRYLRPERVVMSMRRRRLVA